MNYDDGKIDLNDLPCYCSLCGTVCTLVRPGKHQCDNPYHEVMSDINYLLYCAMEVLDQAERYAPDPRAERPNSWFMREQLRKNIERLEVAVTQARKDAKDYSVKYTGVDDYDES